MSWSRRIIEIESGRISGVTSPNGVTAFKGVPYAHPPLGAFRWQPPGSPTSWAGVRDCSIVGPRCVQPDRNVKSIGYYGPEVESEDCLYLNVWTANGSAAEKRPVMVWFHGGAFFQGSGAIPPFQGQNLAARGVVVITVNYRLGRLGFLAHPELTRESINAASGNYGLLDQVAALSWIKRNIATFGGDPDCSSCGCVASMGLAAVAAHRLGGIIPVGAIFKASIKIGQARSKRQPPIVDEPLRVLG